jgi:hypothetical protein
VPGLRTSARRTEEHDGPANDGSQEYYDSYDIDCHGVEEGYEVRRGNHNCSLS